MNSQELQKYEYNTRKYREYEMKILKMAGYLSDYYIDRAIEVDDFSQLSSFLIDYFAGQAGRTFDIGYLISKYKEYGLNEKAEDIDFNLNDWYKIKYELDQSFISDSQHNVQMNEDEYVQYMIEKRKKEIEE